MMSSIRRAVIAAVSVALTGAVAPLAAAGPAVAAAGRTVTAGRAVTAAPRVTCAPWDGAEPPDSNLASLSAVTVLPSCQAWAVGMVSNRHPDQILIEEFNGTTWVRQAVPDTGRVSELAGVAATSAANAWAVGSDNLAGGSSRALILRWDGGSWTPHVTPALPASAASSVLTGVAASSAGNAWAVGSYVTGKVHHSLILRSDGTSWSTVPSPDPGGRAHDSFLTSVTVLGPGDAWAAGYYYSASFAGSRTLILHWNGATWSRIPSPTPAPGHQGQLDGITVTSRRNAWAVGYTITPHSGQPTGKTLILHWNGRAWSQQPSPNPPSPNKPPLRQLYAVSATSASNAWAAGTQERGLDQTLILHWDGHAWQWTPSPPMAEFQFLNGVAASPSGGVWAVGSWDSSLPAGRPQGGPLALRWTGQTWQQ